MSDQVYQDRAPERRSDGSGDAPQQDGLEPLMRIDPVPVRAVFAADDAGGLLWQDCGWRLVAVEPCEANAEDGGTPGSLAMEVFPDEAEGYYPNLTSGEPSIFVKWRLPEDESGVSGQGGEPLALSYNEAGRWMDGGERVDRVAMTGRFLSRWARLKRAREQAPVAAHGADAARAAQAEPASNLPSDSWPESASIAALQQNSLVDVPTSSVAAATNPSADLTGLRHNSRHCRRSPHR